MQFFNPNSFAEAIFYFLNAVNNESVEKRLAGIIKLHPEIKQELEETLRPAVALEKSLNAKLDYDKALAYKYFRRLDNLRAFSPISSIGFCLASIMMYHSVLNYVEYSADELHKYFCECSHDEQMLSLLIGLLEGGEMVNHDDCSPEEIARRVKGLPLSYESKWEIINVAFTYRSSMQELLSLVFPAAKLIESAAAECDLVTEHFRKLYSRDNAQTLFESYFRQKLIPIDEIKIAPLIFGFDIKFLLTTRKVNNSGADVSSKKIITADKMLIGIARHLISRSPDDKITLLSEKMQALSDRTRLEMLILISSRKVCGRELCDQFKLSRSALSYHITKLKNMGFIITEFVGDKPYYSADTGEIKRMLDVFLDEIKQEGSSSCRGIIREKQQMTPLAGNISP